MKTFKKSFVFVSILASMTLASCINIPGLDQNPNNSVPEQNNDAPDMGEFTTKVDDEEAKGRILTALRTFKEQDGVLINTAVSQFKLKEVYNSFSAVDQTVISKRNIDINAAFRQSAAVIGLKSTNVNDIQVGYAAANINASIYKPGLDVVNNDKAEVKGAMFRAFIKNDTGYVDLSNHNFREFAPYAMKLASNYDSIDKAKEDFNQLPQKLKTPTGVISSSGVTLPLMDYITNIDGKDLSVYFLEIMKQNAAMDSRFMEFTTNGEDLRVGLEVKKEHVVDLVFAIASAQDETITRDDIVSMIDMPLVLNSMKFDFIINNKNFLDYSKIDVDLSLKRPEEGGDINSKVAIYDDTLIVKADSWYNFDKPYIGFPSDLDNYELVK